MTDSKAGNQAHCSQMPRCLQLTTPNTTGVQFCQQYICLPSSKFARKDINWGFQLPPMGEHVPGQEVEGVLYNRSHKLHPQL